MRRSVRPALSRSTEVRWRCWSSTGARSS